MKTEYMYIYIFIFFLIYTRTARNDQISPPTLQQCTVSNATSRDGFALETGARVIRSKKNEEKSFIVSILCILHILIIIIIISMCATE